MAESASDSLFLAFQRLHASPNSTQPFRLLDLPREVRDNVYLQCLHVNDQSCTTPYGLPHRLPHTRGRYMTYSVERVEIVYPRNPGDLLAQPNFENRILIRSVSPFLSLSRQIRAEAKEVYMRNLMADHRGDTYRDYGLHAFRDWTRRVLSQDERWAIKKLVVQDNVRLVAGEGVDAELDIPAVLATHGIP